MTSVEPLSELRNKIDTIDKEILQLINQRASVAIDVAKTKMAEGETGCFYRPDREALVLRRIKALNQGPLDDESAVRLFRELMSACLALEKPLQVAFLGPEGTFTQQAAYKHFGHAACTIAATSIDDIFKLVENDQCQFGVVPIENSTEGVITHTLDRFITSPLQICGEVEIRIHHNLIGSVERLADITEIYSHQQSLAQCRKWLNRTIPDVPLTAVSSNAEAAKLAAKQPDKAAIAGEIAADLYDLKILEKNIEDENDNTTRFLIIGSQIANSTRDDKTSLLISTGNQPGALYKILEPFAEYGISMNRIESRPSRQGLWEYVFFIDIDGHFQDPQIQKVLESLKQRAETVKVLGSYPKAVL